MKKVLLSQEIHPDGKKILEEKYDVITAPDCTVETMKKLAEDVDAIILRTTSKVTKEVIRNARKLKIISRTGAGVDNVDIKEASKKGILVCNLPTANNLSVCEHTIALLMALAKQLPYMDKSVRKLNWKARNANTPVEIEGKILGIIGMGHIGSLVAKKCHDGLGMKILAYDPYVEEKYSAYDYKFVKDPDEIFKRADFVTLHCPNIPETKGMVSKERMAMMKPGAYLINCARGEVVVEEDLIEVLKEKKIAGAGIDVMTKEPPEGDNPLLKMDNVILSPHVAALTKEARKRMTMEAVEAVEDMLEGREPKYIYNHKELSLYKDKEKINVDIDNKGISL